MSRPASIRLTPDQLEECRTMGFKNESEYLRWKLGSLDDEDIERIAEQKKQLLALNAVSLNGLNGTQTKLPFESTPLPVVNFSRSIEDAVRLAKMEAELERYKSELASTRKKESDELGGVEYVVNDRVNQKLKEYEHQQLMLDKGKLELALKEKELEIATLKSKLEESGKKLNTLEITERILPHANKVLAGLGHALIKAKAGEGLGGFLAGFGEVIQEEGVKLSEEDERDLELGRNLTAMFTQEELQNVLLCVAVMGQEKTLIPKIPVILQKLTASSKNTPPSQTVEKNDNNSEEQSEENPEVQYDQGEHGHGDVEDEGWM